jgi:cytochrome c peroxidase
MRMFSATGSRRALLAALIMTGLAMARDPALSPEAELGRRIFSDPSLSGSGRLACASCHDPTHAYGPPDGAAVRLGGIAMNRQGIRAVPSLRYVLNHTPVWNRPYVANPAERMLEGNEPPTGGFGWDGRFSSLHEQAGAALLAANEMAGSDPAAIARKLQGAPYAKQFRQRFGADIFAHPAQAFARTLQALERFELEAPGLHPFSSRFDAYLDGRATLSALEKRGLALFDDPSRGNCASCHPDRKGADGSHPLFTDYQFEALGVPRNPRIAANQDPAYADEGLCGPLRTDQAARENCGLFKTPTLRNVALRGVFFHNGRFHTLKDALRFYVRRDTDPQLWYPVAPGGAVQKFDDLPVALRVNVDVIDAPLTRRAGQSPVWTDAEIDAVIAFLGTLNDRDVLPAKPAP